MMPRVDGWTVAQELRADERTKGIPIVFLTARATANDRRRAEKLGAHGYVLKPFDPVRLAPLVADVVARCARGEGEELRRERSPELWPADLEG
jgi:CheY-like chemotaxis protein